MKMLFFKVDRMAYFIVQISYKRGIVRITPDQNEQRLIKKKVPL